MVTDVRRILHQYWGYADFRPLQREIIESVLSGRDTLALMPTGGGKSLTFQVPALCMDGLCLVVTPLIALMRDQVSHLREKNILAAAIYGDMGAAAIERVFSRCLYGNVKLLYVSPERLQNEQFRNVMSQMRISMVAVDEAHCISQWGYDFRPSYLQIAELRDLLPHVPFLAVTATATPQVVRDIQEKLRFDKGQVFRMSFERKNLHYIVRKVEDKNKYLLRILSNSEGSAIVYVRSRVETREVSEFLTKHGICSDHFHAGLLPRQKELVQADWSAGRTRVIVATNAFGMGIDKSDVRVVVHLDAPDSLEAYFQEAGRAGRDGLESYAVLLFSPDEVKRLRMRVHERYPSDDIVRKVYAHLCYHLELAMGVGMGCKFPIDLERFCFSQHLMPHVVNGSLHVLQSCGYLKLTGENDNASRVVMRVTHSDLYKNWGMTVEEEVVLDAVLRMYTGLFMNYAYISEEDIAQRIGSDRQRVYIALRGIANKGVIGYIPYRRAPFVEFLTPRIDEKDLNLNRGDLDCQRRAYTERVEKMIEYCTTEDVCRSQMLSRYFGDDSAQPCGGCDVCRGARL